MTTEHKPHSELGVASSIEGLVGGPHGVKEPSGSAAPSIIDIPSEREWIAERRLAQARMSGTAWSALRRYELSLHELESWRVTVDVLEDKEAMVDLYESEKERADNLEEAAEHANELLGDANETLATRNAALVEQLEAAQKALAIYADPDSWNHVQSSETGSAWEKRRGHPTPWVDAQEVSSPASTPDAQKGGTDA